MNARTRSAVLSDSERPPSIWRIRFGSPSAFMPNVVGLRPVLPRNAFSRVLNCSSRVCMRAVPTVSWPVTLKGPLPGSQLLGNLLSVRGARSYPTLSGRLWRPPPVQWRTPPRGRGCEAGGMGCEARPGEPGPGAAGAGCAPAGATEREGPWEPDAVREAGPVAGKRTALGQRVDSRRGGGRRVRPGRARHGMRRGRAPLQRLRAVVRGRRDGGTGWCGHSVSPISSSSRRTTLR